MSGSKETPAGNRVVVVGLDGATFDLIQPWIDGGELPELRNILRSGASGRLRSTVPPLTPPAWSSFMTGKNPGKHGIYYFTARDSASGREVPVHAGHRSGRTLWDLLSQQGKKVLVLNVPTTYPPRPLNGVIISDFLTPKGSTDFIYPQALVDEIETRFGPYPLYLKTPMFSANLSPANLEAFLEELHHELQYKFQVTHYLMDRYAPDFTMLHIWGTDRVQHELWNLLDAGHPRYDRTLAARYGDRIVEYFRQVDAAIGRLEARLDGNATFFIVSDHGFGPVHREIDLNVWLLQEGYIAIKRSPLSQLRFLAWKTGLTYEFLLRLLLKAMRRRWLRLPDTPPAEGLKLIQEGLNLPLLSMKDVDWARTRAYAKHGVDTGAIHLNIVGRERHGSVTPGKEYEALREEIVQKLRALTDPATRQPVGGEIYTKEELYHGDHLDEAPDIVFLPMANNYLAEALLTFTTRRPIVDNYTFPGNHRMDGILMAKGKPVRANCHIDGAQIIDMAPTILYLMGSPVPKDMDGEVLTDMFTDEFLDGHPLERADPPPEESNAGYAMSPSDEAHIVRRLQDMGYL